MVPLDQLLQLTGEVENASTGDSPPESTENKESMRSGYMSTGLLLRLMQDTRA